MSGDARRDQRGVLVLRLLLDGEELLLRLTPDAGGTRPGFAHAFGFAWEHASRELRAPFRDLLRAARGLPWVAAPAEEVLAWCRRALPGASVALVRVERGRFARSPWFARGRDADDGALLP